MGQLLSSVSPVSISSSVVSANRFNKPTIIMFRAALALLLISIAVADAFVSKYGGVGVGVGAVGGSTTVVHSRKHLPVVGGFGLGGLGGYGMGGYGGFGGYGLGGFGGFGGFGHGGFGGYY